MARTKLMMMVLSTALLMAGAVFENALNFVEHSPTLLYVAGQFKMATGDTNTALDLIGRAASVGHPESAVAPAKPIAPKSSDQKAGPSVCSKRHSSDKAATKVGALPNGASTTVAIASAASPTPQALMAGFSPNKFRIPFDAVREIKTDARLEHRVRRQQEALAKLEHLRLHTYMIVMQSAPNVQVNIPAPAPVIP